MRTAVRWICAAGCAAAICCLPGCRAEEKDAAARIAEKQVIVVAVLEEEDTGERQEAALLEEKAARYLSEELGVELEIRVMAASELHTAVQEKRVDVAAGYLVAEDMEEINCSVIYGRKAAYLVTVKEQETKENQTESTLLGVSPELSGVLKSYAYSGSLQGGAEEIYVKEAKSRLIEGSMGGYICYEKEARQLLEDGRFLVKDLSGAPKEGYVFTTNHDGYKLLNLINRFLTDELMN